MTIGFRADAETLNAAASTSVVVTKPTGTVNGDVMFAIVAINTSGSITPPAGWTEIATAQHGSSPAVRMSAWYRVASSEGSDYTFTFASSRNWGWIGSYTGIDVDDIVNLYDVNEGYTDIYGVFTGTPGLNNYVGPIDSVFENYMTLTAVANVRNATGAPIAYFAASAPTVERFSDSTNVGAGVDISGSVRDLLSNTQDARHQTGGIPSTTAAGDSCTLAVLIKPAMVNTFDGGQPDFTVRMAFGADPDGDPDLWSWTDVTDRVLSSTGVTITEGSNAESGRSVPTKIDFVLRNHPGPVSGAADFTPENPMSQYWPNVVERVPVQVTVPYGYAATTELATCFVASYTPDWLDETAGVPGGAIMRITAAGHNRAPGQPFKPAVERAVANGILPREYWPCQDGPDSFGAASAVGGAALTVSDVTFSGSSDIVGSDPLMTLSTTSIVTGNIRPYTDTANWMFYFATRIEAVPAADTELFEVISSGTAKYWRGRITLSGEYEVRIYSASNVLLDTISVTMSTEHFGLAQVFMIESDDSSPNTVVRASVLTEDGTGSSDALNILGSTAGIGVSFRFFGSTMMNGRPIGHAVFQPTITTSPFSSLADNQRMARALNGHNNEFPPNRFIRLCEEEGREYEIVRDHILATSFTMGPQGTNSFLGLLREVEDLFLGSTVHDGGSNGAMVYTMHGFRQNAQVRITLDMEGKSLAKPFKPIFDDQRRHDLVTVVRDGGSSATVTAVEKPAYPVRKTLSVATDRNLEILAGGRLAIGQATGARYPVVSTNLRRTPGVLEEVLRCRIGSRISIINLMLAHPDTTNVDAFIEGRTIRMTADSWTVDYVISPASPWNNAILDDAVYGRLDTSGCELPVAITSSATTFDIATTDGPLPTVDSAEWTDYVLYLDLGGVGRIRAEQILVTDIDANLITFGTTGTVAHAVNASVTPGIPASVAAGDLLIVFAAIRNSGTGTVNTPTGYTLLAGSESGNARLFGKIATSASETAPTVSFSDGAAGADTSAQMIRVAGKFHAVGNLVVAAAASLNASAQDIQYPGLIVPEDNCLILYWGWKQDDWTSVSGPGTEIGEPDTTTGDDQGTVWAYQIQTTKATIAPGVFTVTGGGAAISAGGVLALRCDRSTITAVRSANGVVKAHDAEAAVRLWDGMYPATG